VLGGVFHAAVLFLVAAGLQLVFGVQKILNLACGSFYALGAYAGRARAPEGDFVAALSVGYRPTFGGTQLRVEAFLLDFEGDLYQKRLELRFLRYLHPDIKFATPDDLVRQLKQDVADTRRFVSR